MRWFMALCAIMLAAGSEPAAARGPINPIRIGNWVGGSFTNDQTGQFSHCVVTAHYGSGVDMHVSVTAGGEWLLGFSHPNWSLIVGKSMPVDLTFDGSGPVRVYALPKTRQFAVIGMPIDGELIRAFRAAQIMTAYAEGSRFQFKLTGTSRMLPALVDCVRNRGGGDTAVAPAPPANRPASANPEALAEREKLISEAAAEHGRCIRTQMRSIVPYSSENAETLAKVILTKCEDAEAKFISLGMALFNTSREEIQRIVGPALEKQKSTIIADIVTFRAELARAIGSQPKPDGGVKPPTEDKGI